MKKVILFLSAVATLCFVSCAKQSHGYGGDELELVIEELEGSATKAALTDVELDKKGDVCPSSQVLTAKLQYAKTGEKVSGEVKYVWDPKLNGCANSVTDSKDDAKNTLTAMKAGSGSISVSATYKGQNVTSNDVPVSVIESEIEGIKLLGSGLDWSAKIIDNSILTSSYFSNSKLNNPLSKDGDSNVSLFFLYDSRIENFNETSSSVVCYNNSSSLWSEIQPYLCLYVEVSYKGTDKKKKVNISDGVEYTFLDKKGTTYPNYEPGTRLGSSSDDYSHYDIYRMGFPDPSSTLNGYLSRYFGDHQVKASYKGFESSLNFNIAFNHDGFSRIGKTCDIHGWYRGPLGGTHHDSYPNSQNKRSLLVNGNGGDKFYETWGVTFPWFSNYFNYTIRKDGWTKSGLTYTYTRGIDGKGVHVTNGMRPSEYPEKGWYIEASQDSDIIQNVFAVYFLNECIFKVGCGPYLVYYEGVEFVYPEVDGELW